MVSVHGGCLVVVVLVDNVMLVVGVVEDVDVGVGRGGCQSVFGITQVMQNLILGRPFKYRPVAAPATPPCAVGALWNRWQRPGLQGQPGNYLKALQMLDLIEDNQNKK